MSKDVDIQDGGYITGSNINVASFTDTHIAPAVAQEFTTMYETF